MKTIALILILSPLFAWYVSWIISVFIRKDWESVWIILSLISIVGFDFIQK